MKKYLILAWVLLLSGGQNIYANTPTEALEISVNKLMEIATNQTSDEATKRAALSDVLSTELDFTAASKRVVSKPWRKATAEQKLQFKEMFLTIITNTYYELLKNYSDEKVEFLKEQLKGTKYAIVDTAIISGNKKIPVRYRLIKAGDSWKIYDFIPEGISLISTYRKNYKGVLSKSGVEGLLVEMKKSEMKKAATKDTEDQTAKE